MGVVRVFHSISPFIDPNTKEGWVSLSFLRVARVSLNLFLEDGGENAKSLNPR